MRALGDLPSQVKLVIYQLIAIEDRSKAELVFPSFKEIAHNPPLVPPSIDVARGQTMAARDAAEADPRGEKGAN